MDKFIAHILGVDDDDGIRSLDKKYLNENNFSIKSFSCSSFKYKSSFIIGKLY